MNIALVHDYLLRFGGAERVLKELHAMYPQAPIYVLFADPELLAEHFPDAEVKVSFLNRFPFLRSSHRWSLPLLPFAVEAFDFRDYDVVISSASGFVKGVITRSRAAHVSYCHTPPRFLWEDREHYRRAHIPKPLSIFASPVLHGLRLWDQHAAQRVDHFLANSAYTAKRIARYYRRSAQVIVPPVDTTVQPLRAETRKRFGLPEEYFLLVSRLAWWKRPDLAVLAFNHIDLPLVVVGSGPMEKKLRKSAQKNIRFLGWQSDALVREIMQGARALIHPQVEDFGMTIIESMASGTPIIAYRDGGAVETVEDGVSGVFFDDPDPIALADAVRRLREGRFDPERIRASAQHYTLEQFRESIEKAVDGAYDVSRSTTG